MVEKKKRELLHNIIFTKHSTITLSHKDLTVRTRQILVAIRM